MSVLAIDAGTTGVTALLVDDRAQVVARGYREFPQRFPRPGWVEHDPEDIWQATLHACAAALADEPEPPVAIGLTNQRETAVVWHRRSLAAPRPAIVWQDRRTTGLCAELREHEQRVSELTGLRLDPYFTGTKLAWLARAEPDTWSGVLDGSLAVGTVDSYLLARLTGGQLHATDPSNASRTLLFDLTTGGWSAEMCDLFGVPAAALPEIHPSSGKLADTDPEQFLGLRAPIAGVAGDQQAALFGQRCFAPGSTKCTYGTGSFVLTNTGCRPLPSAAGLLTTAAWDLGDGLTYAMEGAVFVTGAAVQWLRDGLGLIHTAADVEQLAGSVSDSGGVVFVPALTGLGAPHWDPDARGAVFGLTRGSTAGHLARATLEAIACEVRDVVEAMNGETETPVGTLAVDGGAAANDLLCELQATLLQVPVQRPAVLETTGLGAAFLAGLATGVWGSTDELVEVAAPERTFQPGAPADGLYRRWQEAVRRTRGWAGVDPG